MGGERTASVSVRVPAKINLDLSVGALGADGFHPVSTVFHAVSLFDDLFECTLEETTAAEAACREKHAEEQRRRKIIGLTATFGLTLGGGVLFGHGVYSIRRIRVARRELDLEYARIGILPEGGAKLSLGVSF